MVWQTDDHKMWGQMSNAAVEWAYSLDLKTGPKFVLVTLGNWADQEHSCFPGVRLIAERTGMGESTVKEHLAALRAAGLITSERRDRKGGVRTSNRYWLAVDGPFTQGPESGSWVSEPKVQISDTQGPESGLAYKDEPSVEPSVEANASRRIAETRPDIDALCRTLSERVIANGVRKAKGRITAEWRDAARLLLDYDKVPLAEAMRVLNWSQDDGFWRTNILSMPTFRAKYDQLKLAMERPARSNKKPKDEQIMDVLEMGRRMMQSDGREIEA